MVERRCKHPMTIDCIYLLNSDLQVMFLLVVDCISTALDIYWIYTYVITNFGACRLFANYFIRIEK